MSAARRQRQGQDDELLVLEQARCLPRLISNCWMRSTAIAGKIGAIKVIRRGRLGGQPIYRIAVRLSQFDETVGGSANARFDWAITHSTQACSAS